MAAPLSSSPSSSSLAGPGSLSRLVTGAVVVASAVVPLILVAVAASLLWRGAVDAQVARGQQVATTTATLLGVANETGSGADLEVARAYVGAVVGDGSGDLDAIVAIDPAGAVVVGAAGGRHPDVKAALATLSTSALPGVVIDATITARDRRTRAESPAGRVLVGLRPPPMPWRVVIGLGLLGMALAAAVILVVTSLLRRRAILPLEDLTRGLLAVGEGRVDAGVAEIDQVRSPGVRPVREVEGLLDAFDAMVRGVRERQTLLSRLEQGVGAQVAADTSILEAPPRRADVSVVVVDIRDFTALQASLRPEQVGAFVDGLLSAFVTVVERHGGHVERFLGDGLVAIFGAPRATTDHAVRACACALDLEAAARRLAEQGQQQGVARFVVGVGVASGSATVGAVGPPRRRVYQAMGDVPALARKIQQEAKSQGLGALVSDVVFAAAREGLVGVTWKKLPPMVMRGVGMPVTLYRPERPARDHDDVTALVGRSSP
jgi:class 3 adenylate cyclase